MDKNKRQEMIESIAEFLVENRNEYIVIKDTTKVEQSEVYYDSSENEDCTISTIRLSFKTVNTPNIKGLKNWILLMRDIHNEIIKRYETLHN